MKEHINRAIQERRLLRLVYAMRRRLTLAPYALGCLNDGREALLCRQISPPPNDGAGWRVLVLDEIRDLLLLEQAFAAAETNPPAMEAFHVMDLAPAASQEFTERTEGHPGRDVGRQF